MKILAGIIIFAGVITSVVVIASLVFKGRYLSDIKAALSSPAPVSPEILTEESIASLPGPVQGYIRYTGALGKPAVRNMKITFTGQIRSAEGSPWMNFTTEQYNFLNPAWRLFFMKARIKGLPVAGYHAFKNGIAYMDIRLLSLVKVQYHDGEKMNVAETVTFFNDMCCMAPGSLLDDRIEWLGTEGNVVRAAFTNNAVRITAWLYFNDEGALVNFVSDDRWAIEEGGKLSQIRWETPIFNYREINGHRLASGADLIYKYPAGDFCYGKFVMGSIMYNVTE
jgi:hypothetical protein